MLITDKNVLRSYGAPYRLWQGIPSIEVTKGGRMFVTFYSGGTKEEIGNFVLLYASRDHKSFGDPIAVAFKEECRCFDPCLWIDPICCFVKTHLFTPAVHIRRLRQVQIY